MGWSKTVLVLVACGIALVSSCGGTSSTAPLLVDAGDGSATDDGSGSGGTGSSCVPGESKACAGPNACAGFQVCADDGARYGACQCGDGGTGGTSGAATGGAGGTIVIDGGGTGGTGGSFDACAGAVYAAEGIPLDMLILLDQSGSMTNAEGTSTRWDLVTNALRTFVEAPESAGIGVGIQYFPYPGPQVTCIATNNPPGCSCTGICPGLSCLCFYSAGSCDVATYAVPDVPIQPLPGVAPDIVASLANHAPSGGTPTTPALQGAMQYATSYAATQPSHKVIVVLATDGAPNDCSSTVTTVADVAAAGVASNPPIQTFVIGIGDIANLDTIAQAGGTTRAFLVDAATAGQGLLNAMNTIRGSVASCSLQIPTPTGGGVIDFSRAELRYAPAGGATEVVPRVTSAAECNSTTGGWHYDNPSQPGAIELCPATCDRIRAGGSLSVAVACT